MEYNPWLNRILKIGYKQGIQNASVELELSDNNGFVAFSFHLWMILVCV